MISGFNFGENTPVPCSDARAKYARAVIDMVQSNDALEQAKANVPDYTGQWSDSDYYGDELEAWYRAADTLAETAAVIFTGAAAG